MFKVYFKQALKLLKQNKFISVITIVGTALAIMMVMVIIVTDQIKNNNLAPEVNRDKSWYVKYYQLEQREGTSTKSSYLNYFMYKDYLSEVKSYDIATVFVPPEPDELYIVRAKDNDKRFYEPIVCCDANFWKVMSYSFIEGRPFTQVEFDDGIHNVILSEKLAKKLFGNESAINKTVYIFKQAYEVIGVVENVSRAFEFTSGEVLMPFTATPDYESWPYHIIYLLEDNKMAAELDKEVRAAEQRFNAVDDEWDITFRGPYNHRTQMSAVWANVDPNPFMDLMRRILIIAILLIIPAINLSSFSISRVKRRMEEIGIRKAFGAKNRVILNQILYENLITSLLGGIIGLVLSYITVIWLKDWLLNAGAGDTLPLSAFVMPSIFLYVFIVCVLLNLLSAIVPAYKAARMNIVSSLNRNE
ncbi:ABC transporter permease [Odoribacter sp. OttesenSCG-928-L07]|nr:ABC transporter permease [Odoribacter sp. OttesenSCG-928-L07]MDL2239765.1 ABC transporter permease [Bacteroidales bacterium OttesenSCG-928-L14]